MPKAFRIARTGGPEVLEWQDVPLPAPGAGEAQLRHTAIGLNYIDIYHRSGVYPVGLPSGIGMEAAGVITALGKGVKDFKIGDRVAYVAVPLGAYAEARNISARVLVKLPKAIDDVTAAAAMLKGLTVQYLIRRTYRVKKGEWVLLHAAAGGVGLIASQWLKHLGARVIGTAGSPEKARLAKKMGCAHVIDYRKEDVVKRVKSITKGEGVAVVYDGIGKDTFDASLDCLRPLGTMVSYGNASGVVPPVSIGVLSAKGSLFLTRPTIMTHIAKREDLLQMARELFAVVKSGAVRIQINQTYALKDAARAQRDLESRKTTGSTVLLP